MKLLTRISCLIFLSLFNMNSAKAADAPGFLLLYTDIKNHLYHTQKEIDLVLFSPGYGCKCNFLLRSFATGGLNLTTGKKHFTDNLYRKDILFACIDSSSLFFSTPETINDSTKTIKKLMQFYKIRKIYLVGGSAGASFVLNFASLTDNKIKNKIAGIIAYLPVTDYEYTYRKTNLQELKTAIEAHLNANDNKIMLEDSSPITYVDKLPSKAKIILIAGIYDKVVPFKEIKDYYNKAKKMNKNIHLHEVETEHNTNQITFPYIKALDDLLK